MRIPYPSSTPMSILYIILVITSLLGNSFIPILYAQEIISSSTTSSSSSTASSGVYRFSLSRRHITVPVNSTLHHRYGNFERRINTVNDPLSSSNENTNENTDRRTQDEVPIYGDFRRLAYFYADIFIGSGPQKFTVITDTGSSLTAIPCIDCGNCGTHMNPRFNPAQSSTAQLVSCSSGCPGSSHCTANKCNYVQSYAEGSSIRGTLYQDIVYTGGDISGGIPAEYAIPFRFGCGTSEGGLFVTQEADGIMGLGQSDMSIIRALWDSQKLNNNMFSLCLAMTGGTFTLGEMDPRLHQSPIAWAKMNLAGFYVVPVGGISVDQYPLRFERMNIPHTILDSGTTFTYLPTETYSDLRSAITQFCSGDRVNRCKGNPVNVPNEAVCYRLSDPNDIHSFPSAHVTLQGIDGTPVTINVLPQYLFINMGWDGGAYCLSMYDNGDRGGVIGANVMMGHDVVFDMAGTGAGPRAGFAPSTCQIPPPGNPTPSSTPSPTVTGSPSGTTVPVAPSLLPSPSVLPPGVTPSSVPVSSPSSMAPTPFAPAILPSSSSAPIDNTQHDPPNSTSDSSTTIIIAVMSTLIVGCILMYCCLSCECRIGRMVIRLENAKSENRVRRYARINERNGNTNQHTARNGELSPSNIDDNDDDLFDDEVTLSSPKSIGSNNGSSNRRVQAVRENAGTGTVVTKTNTTTTSTPSTKSSGTVSKGSTTKRVQGESEEQTAALDKMAAALSMGSTSPAPSTTSSISTTTSTVVKKSKETARDSASVVINVKSNENKQ